MCVCACVCVCAPVQRNLCAPSFQIATDCVSAPSLPPSCSHCLRSLACHCNQHLLPAAPLSASLSPKLSRHSFTLLLFLTATLQLFLPLFRPLPFPFASHLRPAYYLLVLCNVHVTSLSFHISSFGLQQLFQRRQMQIIVVTVKTSEKGDSDLVFLIEKGRCLQYHKWLS